MSLVCKDLAFDDCEIKFQSAESGTFEGYASTFGNKDHQNDIIEKGAYSDTLKNRKTPVLMLFGHNPGRVIGKWTGLSEDTRGLYVKGEFTPGHTDAQNVRASAKHGAISGMSVGIMVNDKQEEGDIRIIKSVSLVEISLVSMPANDEARIDAGTVKALAEGMDSLKDAERILRDSGWSRSAACDFVSHMKSLAQGDPEDVADLKAELESVKAKYIKAKTALLRNGIFI